MCCLTGKATAPRLKTVKINGNVALLKKNVSFNNLFVLNSLNVANGYIFKCQNVIKVKKGERIPGLVKKLTNFSSLLEIFSFFGC